MYRHDGHVFKPETLRRFRLVNSRRRRPSRQSRDFRFRVDWSARGLRAARGTVDTGVCLELDRSEWSTGSVSGGRPGGATRYEDPVF
jgi:hypothetical protein